MPTAPPRKVAAKNLPGGGSKPTLPENHCHGTLRGNDGHEWGCFRVLGDPYKGKEKAEFSHRSNPTPTLSHHMLSHRASVPRPHSFLSSPGLLQTDCKLPHCYGLLPFGSSLHSQFLWPQNCTCQLTAGPVEAKCIAKVKWEWLTHGSRPSYNHRSISFYYF